MPHDQTGSQSGCATTARKMFRPSPPRFLNEASGTTGFGLLGHRVVGVRSIVRIPPDTLADGKGEKHPSEYGFLKFLPRPSWHNHSGCGSGRPANKMFRVSGTVQMHFAWIQVNSRRLFS
jgi:hypothetical protein